MSLARAFLGQPARRYRDFQVAYTVLTLNFAIPVLSYIFAPEAAAAQFAFVDRVLGGPGALDDLRNDFWRYLGSANVATLALMCALLQLNLRRYYPVLVPLVFLKGMAAALFLGGFLAHGTRIFLAAAVLDSVTSAAFVFFARRAHLEIRDRPDAELVPPPQGWV